MDNAGLNGLNLNAQSLTPPDQLLAKAQQDKPQTVVDVNYVQDQTENAGTLKKNDNFSASTNVISSALAGGIATSKIAKDVNVLGESTRAPHVQNTMSQIEARHNDYGSYSRGNNYNNYDPYGGYGGGIESVRGRGYNNYNNNRNYYDRGYNNYDRRYGGVENFDDFANGMKPETRMAMKDVAGGAVQGAKYGALIGGGVSALVNAWNVVTGKQKTPDAVGAVAADTVTASLSGASGAVAGGLASFGLGAVGIAGVPGLALSIGIGTVGAVASQLLFQKTGLYDAIKDKVRSMVGGK
ncbi:MAG: hypothetical protein U0457_03030 [Candidatus Sericytochromatia bacterium]